nr:hypothetical protein Q903MT_gene1934 [Picea sitchensis]
MFLFLHVPHFYLYEYFTFTMKFMKIDPLFVIPHKNILPDSLIRGKRLNSGI